MTSLSSQPVANTNHTLGNTLPFLSSRPTVIFPAIEHICPLSITKLYDYTITDWILAVTETWHMHENNLSGVIGSK